MNPFSWQGQNQCWLSLVFIKDWRGSIIFDPKWHHLPSYFFTVFCVLLFPWVQQERRVTTRFFHSNAPFNYLLNSTLQLVLVLCIGGLYSSMAMRRLSKAHYNCYCKSWKLTAKWRNTEDLIAGLEVFLKVGPMPQTSIGVIKFWGACFISICFYRHFFIGSWKYLVTNTKIKTFFIWPIKNKPM